MEEKGEEKRQDSERKTGHKDKEGKEKCHKFSLNEGGRRKPSS